jgi:hypothetical protein
MHSGTSSHPLWLSNPMQSKTNLAPAYPEDLERASAQGTILSVELYGVMYGKGRVREHSKHHVVVHLIIFAFAALALASIVVLTKRSQWSECMSAIENIFKRKKQLKAELYELEDDIPIFDLVEQHQMVKTKVPMAREQSIPQRSKNKMKELLRKMNRLISSRSNISDKTFDELASQVYETMEDKTINEATDHETSSDSSSDRFIDEPTDKSSVKTDLTSRFTLRTDKSSVKTDLTSRFTLDGLSKGKSVKSKK